MGSQIMKTNYILGGNMLSVSRRTSNIIFKVRNVPKSANGSVAFSGAGWLTPFHIGVIDKLNEVDYFKVEHLDRKDWPIIAGSSGGSIAALSVCTGISVAKSLELTYEMCESDEFKQNIAEGLRRSLQELVPEDAVYKCNGRLHVLVSKIKPLKEVKLHTIKQFHSRDDIIDAVVASCHIPIFSGPNWITTFRNERAYVDGGLLGGLMPNVGNLRVSPFPEVVFKSLRQSHLAPHISMEELENPSYSLLELGYRGFKPKDREYMYQLFRSGQTATQIYLNKHPVTHKNAKPMV